MNILMLYVNRTALFSMGIFRFFEENFGLNKGIVTADSYRDNLYPFGEYTNFRSIYKTESRRGDLNINQRDLRILINKNIFIKH